MFHVSYAFTAQRSPRIMRAIIDSHGRLVKTQQDARTTGPLVATTTTASFVEHHPQPEALKLPPAVSETGPPGPPSPAQSTPVYPSDSPSSKMIQHTPGVDRDAEFFARLKAEKQEKEAAEIARKEAALTLLSDEERAAKLEAEQAEEERSRRAEQLRKKNLAGYTSSAAKIGRGRGRGRGRGKR